MSDDTLKTFDNLSSISNQDIDDALDIIPISHGVGTISQGDKKVKIGQLQQMTVLRCRTNGNVANKQAEYVGGLPLNGNSQACIGRTVLVIFDNKNTAAEPTFSFKNLTGPIILLNQASNVTLGSGCVLANSRNIMTWDGQNWCLHSDIAEITSDYTKYADGRIVYSDNYIIRISEFKTLDEITEIIYNSIPEEIYIKGLCSAYGQGLRPFEAFSYYGRPYGFVRLYNYNGTSMHLLCCDNNAKVYKDIQIY